MPVEEDVRGFASRIYEIPGRRSRLSAMEGLRAYAAFVVFFVHFTAMFVRRTYGISLDDVAIGQGQNPLFTFYIWLNRSHYGVDLFFILSGYLIFRLVASPRFSYGLFLRDRWLRIYPVFLVTTCAIGGLIYGAARLVSWNFVANLFFLNGVPELGVDAVSVPTWSLFFEFAFYIVFPVILLFRRGGELKAHHVLGFAAVAAVGAYFVPSGYVRFLMFFPGALLASLDRERLKALAARLPDLGIVMIYIASTAFFATRPDTRVFTAIFLVTGTALVVNVLFGSGFLHRFFERPFLRYMGNISFSFYLVHPLAIGVVFHFARPWLALGGAAEFLGLAGTFVASVLLSVALASGLFIVFERPYFVWKHGAPGSRVPDAEEPLTEAFTMGGGRRTNERF
jgi:exopolysaccharide production protein ExoZ